MTQEASVKILRKLNEAKRELHGKNVQGCLLQFKTALDIAVTETILPADKKAVQEEIEQLQGEIQKSAAFTQIYGPVTFKGSEFDVTLSFVKELIQASAEELFESTELSSQEIKEKPSPKVQDAPASDKDALFKAAMEKINSDDLVKAREIIGGDEEVLDRVIDALNNNGISLRSSGNYEGALSCYNKGIELRPNEEGLHYNMARACFEKGDAAGALTCLESALSINPDFAPGKDLRDFIKGKMHPPRPEGIVAEAGETIEEVGANKNGKRGVLVSFKNLFGKKRT